MRPEPSPGTDGSQLAAAAAPPDLMLLLIRHAEQATMRIADADLSERGVVQASLLAERLAALPPTAVVSSPLRRARQTAEIVARRCRLQPEVEPGLEEYRLTPEARERRYTHSPARAMEPDPGDYAASALAGVRVIPRTGRWLNMDGVESIEAVRARGQAAIDRAVARHPGGVVACISHGGLINAVVGSWLGVVDDMWFVPWHTGISAVLLRADRRILLTLNDAAHLGGDQDMLGLVAGHVRG